MPTNPTDPPRHLLVTAGPTREEIDDVRDWGNIFTGRTGLELALAFLDLGHVTLLTSNLDHARDFDGYSGKAGMLGIETFRTHADLRELLAERMTSGDPPPRVDVVAMTAAVADYRPESVFRVLKRDVAGETGPSTREIWEVENVSAAKVKSAYDEIAVLGTRTEKLIDLFRTKWAYRGLLIKFKLEVGLPDDELLRVAAASRKASGADLMVANTLAMARPISGEGGAFLISDDATERVSRGQLAHQVTSWVQSHLHA